MMTKDQVYTIAGPALLDAHTDQEPAHELAQTPLQIPPKQTPQLDTHGMEQTQLFQICGELSRFITIQRIRLLDF
jgi:hypothetical protein